MKNSGQKPEKNQTVINLLGPFWQCCMGDDRFQDCQKSARLAILKPIISHHNLPNLFKNWNFFTALLSTQEGCFHMIITKIMAATSSYNLASQRMYECLCLNRQA